MLAVCMSKISSEYRGFNFCEQVPRIFIGGKCIGGASELWTLQNEEKLVPMLKECNATFTESNKKED